MRAVPVLTYEDASIARGKATADSDIVEARFVDIVPGVRVVQAVDFVSDDPAHAGAMTMTWSATGRRRDARGHPRRRRPCYVAWVGEGTDVGLTDALTTWFGEPTAP